MDKSNRKARLLAFYLPQYHPIPENDKWWGKGFTEWTNVTKAKPLFNGHYQPRFPADLGYYDLRVSEVREQQAELAKENGIEGFIYYHYWFGNGKRLLERPFDEVLKSGKPNFPFCLCWANETWKGIWFGKSGSTLIEQTYPGKEDYINHFSYLLKAFSDERYIKVDGKPLFSVYLPAQIPDMNEFTDVFRELAHKSGLKGLHLVAARSPQGWDPRKYDFDAVIGSEFSTMRYVTAPLYQTKSFSQKVNEKLKNIFSSPLQLNVEKRDKPLIVEYATAIKHLIPDKSFDYTYYPLIIPNWDNSARAGVKSLVFNNSTPELFKVHLSDAFNKIKNYNPENKLIFIKSWNEWAEGNYLEPDSRFGHQYLEVIRDFINLY